MSRAITSFGHTPHHRPGVGCLKLLMLAVTFVVFQSSLVNARQFQPASTVARLGGVDIDIYTYRPAPCANPRVLIIFAGYNRDADRYRDKARAAADRACLLVVAPRLDRDRFPNWRYHRVGIYRKGRIQPQYRWTTHLLKELISWGRQWAGDPAIPYILFGHSAGGQLLSRFAAYSPPIGSHRIVVANPSVHVMPSLTEPVPYGFGGIFDDTERMVRLRHYLALPITIYLGTSDKGNKLLVRSEAARRQGKNRYERGLNAFKQARSMARQNNWKFNWQLVEVPGVGHSSRRMLAAREIVEAFGLAVLEEVN